MGAEKIERGERKEEKRRNNTVGKGNMKQG
jgi:hypothetical protein